MRVDVHVCIDWSFCDLCDWNSVGSGWVAICQTCHSVGERYNSESNWDKLVVEERVHEYQHRCLYGRKVDGRPEVVKIAPPEGLRGFVVLTREKFDGYAAMVR